MKTLSSVHFLVLFSIASLTQPAFADCPYDWRPGQGIPGVNGSVFAMTVWNDGSGSRLVVGGSFSVAGDQFANNIACWDGSRWSGLGAGTNGPVRALTASNGELIAGGSFTIAGGAEANRIARWDGAVWHPLGAGMDRDVRALAVYGGELFAGGQFDRGLARWNGITWTPVGTTPTSGYVFALTVFRDELIAGGIFTVGLGQASYLARWNGTAWSPMGGFQTIYALTVHGNALVAAGDRSVGIRAWNGSTWQVLCTNIAGPSVFALSSNGTDLFAGGYFSSIDGHIANGVARWDGSTWQSLGGYLIGASEPWVYALQPFLEEMVVGGLITGLSGESQPACTGLARWAGGVWNPVGDGMYAPISAAVAYRGQLFAGRSWQAGRDLMRDNLARWNSTGWESIGFAGDRLNGIYALREWNDELIVAGSFPRANGMEVNNIAGWNGARWRSFGAGMNGTVLALCQLGDDLVAAGDFSTADGKPARSIARWRDGSWSEIGGGIDGGVYSLAVFKNDLIAGGVFDRAGGWNALRVARWDGTSWQPLGSGIDGTVDALAVFMGDLFAAGQFWNAGGYPARHIARWDGQSWHSVGEGLNRYAKALLVYNDNLIVGGSFSVADGLPISGVATWNGTAWGTLGSGLYLVPTGGAAQALASFDGELVVGGSCLAAGDHVSAYWARWGPTVPPATITSQPEPQSVPPGKTATFSVTASGQPPLTFQWRKNGVNLVDDQHVSGATTAMLAIHPVRPRDVGIYDVVVTNDCRSITSAAAHLSVSGPSGTRPIAGQFDATITAEPR